MFTKKYVLLAKKEVTYLTDASPTGTNAVEAFDVDFSPERIVKEKNVGTINLGSLPSYISSTLVNVTFKTYLKGPGSKGVTSVLGALLQSCSLSETLVESTSATYEFDETETASTTLYFYRDGLLTKVLGARGTFSLDLTAGEWGVVTWNMKGKYVASTATAIVEPTFEATDPVIVENSDFEMGSGSNVTGIETLTISQEGLEVFKDINNDQGFGKALVVDAIFNGTIDPLIEASNIVTWETALNASTTFAMNYVLGSAAGNTITITAPEVQVTDYSVADKSGLQILNMNLAFRTDSSGTSPITIVVT